MPSYASVRRSRRNGQLRLAVFLFLGRMPTNGGRVEQNVGALEGGETRAFGIPLVPAHQRANRPDLGIERAKAQIARREVELLVIGGIVGDVHLAVDPLHLAGGVDHGGGVVVEAGRASLEQRRDHYDAVLLRNFSQRFRRRARYRFGQIEERVVLALGDVMRAEQLRKANERRTLLRVEVTGAGVVDSSTATGAGGATFRNCDRYTSHCASSARARALPVL